MSVSERPEIGSITWFDLTVPDAEAVRDFYAAVVGWRPEPVDMGGYADFMMNAPDSGRGIAGVCHARGSNADLPPRWLLYITVADVEAAAARCEAEGGEVVVAPRGLAGGRFCVIRDPAGAVVALYAPPEPDDEG